MAILCGMFALLSYNQYHLPSILETCGCFAAGLGTLQTSSSVDGVSEIGTDGIIEVVEFRKRNRVDLGEAPVGCQLEMVW